MHSNKLNNKAFTLIELLAVIIILGILMIIAIPSVTKYISDSRKSAYVNTAKNIMDETRNLVNEGKLGMYDMGATYYIPASCIHTENGLTSPYGDFVRVYVAVTYLGKGYNYYFTSIDNSGIGVKSLQSYDKLSIDHIETDLKEEDIKTNVGIDGKNNIYVFNSDCTGKDSVEIGGTYSSSTGETSQLTKYICKRATSLHTEFNNTFGKLGTPGSLSSGDAFDCDVNGDGTYDAATERFYYMYSSGNVANLIYYINTYNGVPNKTAKVAYYAPAYDGTSGPVTAASHLPSESQWSNVKLQNPNRQITTYQGATSINGVQLPVFSYSGRAARMISYEDARSACGGGTPTNPWYFQSSCLYFMENIVYNGNITAAYGYFTETLNYYAGGAMTVYGYNMDINSAAVNNSNLYGVRPVIEVKISDIEV